MRKWIFGLVLFALVVGSTWLFYQSFDQPYYRGSEPLTAIPTDAALVLETDDAGGIWRDLSRHSAIWQDLLASDVMFSIDRIGAEIDSILTTSGVVRVALSGKRAAISLHPGKDKHTFMAALATDPKVSRNDLRSTLFHIFKAGQPKVHRQIMGMDVYKLGTPLLGAEVFLSFTGDLLLISLDEALMTAALEALISGKGLTSVSDFEEARFTSGMDVRGHVYVRYDAMSRILARYAAPGSVTHPFFTRPFATWSALDFDLKPESATMRGFAQAPDTGGYWIAELNGKAVVAPSLLEKMPVNTVWFAWYGTSSKVNNTRGESGLKATEMCKCAADSLAIAWSDGEAATFIIEPQGVDYAGERFAAFAPSDAYAAWSMLERLWQLLAEGSGEPALSEQWNDYEMIRLPVGSLYAELLGAAFDDVLNPWVVRREGTLYFGHSPTALKPVLTAAESGRVLALADGFTEVKKQISARSQFILYSAPSRSQMLYAHLLDSASAAGLSKQFASLRNFHSFVYEASHYKGNLYYNNIYLSFRKGISIDRPVRWEAELAAPVKAGPWLVENHYTKGKEVLVQDLANNLYLIAEGKILWTVPLDSPIRGGVHQVDIFKNGKLQMLFNTADFLYLVDRNGNAVESFPIRLSAPASAPVSVIDYERNKEYRFFMALTSGAVHAYDVKGQQISGFNFTSEKGEVVYPPELMRIKGKDYILMISASGHIYLTDRQGKKRHEPGLHADALLAGGVKAEQSNQHIAASALYYLDTLGGAYRLRFDGRFDRWEVSKGRAREYFFMFPSGEQQPLCISLWPEGVACTDFTGNTRWKWIPSDGLSIAMGPVALHKGKQAIAVACENPPQVVLLGLDGRVLEGDSFYGNVLPVCGDLNNNGSMQLITAKGPSVFCYEIAAPGED